MKPLFTILTAYTAFVSFFCAITTWSRYHLQDNTYTRIGTFAQLFAKEKIVHSNFLHVTDTSNGPPSSLELA